MKHLVVIPGSPALVEELVPQDSAGQSMVAAARRAVFEALAGGANKVHISYRPDRKDYTAHTGSFRAWGARRTAVSGGNYLPELVARYVIDPVLAELGLESSCVRVASSARSVLGETGLGSAPEEADTLCIVVADGSAGLTMRAPLTLVDTGAWAHAWCQNLLGGTDREPFDHQRLHKAGVLDPTPWAELAELARHATSRELLESDGGLGVGRYVAHWTFHPSMEEN